MGNRGWVGIAAGGAEWLLSPPMFPAPGSTRQVLVTNSKRWMAQGVPIEGKRTWAGIAILHMSGHERFYAAPTGSNKEGKYALIVVENKEKFTVSVLGVSLVGGWGGIAPLGAQLHCAPSSSERVLAVSAL